jgi:hypothetical protein
MNAMTQRLALSLVAVASVLALAGCNPGPRSIETFAGLPDEHDVSGSSEELPEGPQVAWVQDGGRLAVTIWGSSTCPTVGTDLHVVKPAGEGNSVKVDLAPPSDGVCTMDLVPHTTMFWTPLNVTTTEPLTVEIGKETVELPTK